MSEGKQKKSSSSFRWVRRRKSSHEGTRQGSEDRKNQQTWSGMPAYQLDGKTLVFSEVRTVLGQDTTQQGSVI